MAKVEQAADGQDKRTQDQRTKTKGKGAKEPKVEPRELAETELDAVSGGIRRAGENPQE